MNPRQVKVLSKLLDGFEGKLTSSKWGAMMAVPVDAPNRHAASPTAPIPAYHSPFLPPVARARCNEMSKTSPATP